MGLIYRPIDLIRIGGSIQSPTYFHLSDDYFTQMQSDLDTLGSLESSSDDGSYEYDLYTPWRATASLAFVIGKIGFISADYEFVDHSVTYFDFGSGSISDKLAASDINNDIVSKYGQATNLRLGAEVNIKKFRLRGGYALYGSPFKPNVLPASLDQNRKNVSFGFGVKELDYYIDFAFVRSIMGDYNVPYTLDNKTVEGASNSVTFNTLAITMGIKL